ncbi:thermonuclease family protein [Aneurinibacillus migulanus]|uniref:thermonuclease family protein n=1 Tax=Aneurinibacillus migulanus TaxID=47500 RepID=UPI000697EEC2|nr:thermonuclease family protein [Aneurinibacillus migulanus]
MKKTGVLFLSISILLSGCSTSQLDQSMHQTLSKNEENGGGPNIGLNLSTAGKAAEIVDSVAGTDYKSKVGGVETAVQVAGEIKNAVAGSNSTDPVKTIKSAVQAVGNSKGDINSPSSSERVQATVTNIKDGDTIEVRLNGKKETVRFLLIDTPESVKPGVAPQPFSQEASKYVKKKLTGKRVELERDISDARDKYGRLLYYVYVDGQSIQEDLLSKGLARVAYVSPPNVKHVDKYRAIQKEAQKAKLGIWSIEDYVQKDGFHPEVLSK